MRWIALAPVALLLLLCACQKPALVAAPPPVAPVSGVKAAPIDGTAKDTTSEEEEAPADDDAYVGPCVDGPERQAARAAWGDLGTRIGSLDDAADPKPLTDELTNLLTTECFRLSGQAPHDALSFDSAIALRTWWNDGGSDWTESFLAQGEQRVLVVPPSPRRTATKQIGKKHPLASLVCADSDASCAQDTTGWSRRATRALELRAIGQHGSWAKNAETCEKDALGEKAVNKRFLGWESCMDEATLRRTALPLGRIKAPVDGWIVVEGARRCGDLRAYDLASGATYIVNDRCGRAGSPTVKVGRVPVSALREAAWMILVAPLADKSVRVESSRYEVPKLIPIVQPASFGFSITTHCGGCGVSGARQWSWMRDRGGALKGQASGVIHPTAPCDDAEDHAAELLAIVDDSFEEGCAPAAPPAKIAWSDPGGALGERGPPASFDDPDHATLRTALASARPQSLPCAKRP
jgi:hypothetical protein